MLRENRTFADVCMKDVIKKVGKLQILPSKQFLVCKMGFSCFSNYQLSFIKAFFKEIDLVFNFVNAEGEFLPLAYTWNFFLCFVISS